MTFFILAHMQQCWDPLDSAEDGKSFQEAERKHGGHPHSLPAQVRILDWFSLFSIAYIKVIIWQYL
jgi:hypothetical protein